MYMKGKISQRHFLTQQIVDFFHMYYINSKHSWTKGIQQNILEIIFCQSMCYLCDHHLNTSWTFCKHYIYYSLFTV